MDTALILQSRDPVLVRDGRPFGADPGAQARSLDWPLPSTFAGALRTYIGNLNGFTWNKDEVNRAKQFAVQGPLMLVRKADSDWLHYMAAPADAVVFEDASHQKRVVRLSPMQLPEHAGCNLPDGLLPLSVEEECKPADGYTYWPMADVVRWLCGEVIGPPTNALGPLSRDARVHVKINPGSGAHESGGLFATVSLVMPDVQVKPDSHPVVAMLGRVSADVPDAGSANTFLPFGGERRAVLLESTESCWPSCPDALLQAGKGRRLKLQLVTPAIFAGGWKPGWLDTKQIPGVDGLHIERMVSAAIPRRIAVSGWDYETKGPKAARYACPAGTVFFLETREELTPEILKRLWLHSICDHAQDNRDGFGIAVPGIWDYSSGEDK